MNFTASRYPRISRSMTCPSVDGGASRAWFSECPGPPIRFDPRANFAASLVVSLVALPLYVGVAVASAGLLPGSSLQVSGPAAGLTVLVYEAVHGYGVGTLGVLVGQMPVPAPTSTVLAPRRGRPASSSPAPTRADG